MNEIYYPKKELSLDKSMVLWRSRYNIKYICSNNKICTSKNNFYLCIIVFTYLTMVIVKEYILLGVKQYLTKN